MTTTGASYFLIIIDEYTRVTWLYLLNHKHDVVTALENFLNLAETHFSTKVQTVCSHKGGEFVNAKCQELFHLRGILHYRTCSYTSQQNEVVERKHKHLLEITRALLLEAQLPTRF